MDREVSKESIKKKLSGKYSNLYPVYVKLRNILLNLGPDVQIILKTKYIIVIAGSKLLAAIYWETGALEVFISTTMKDKSIIVPQIQKYKGLDNSIIFTNTDDIDDTTKKIFHYIYIS